MSHCDHCGIDVGEPDIGDRSAGGTPWAIGVVLCDKCYSTACERMKPQPNPATDITDYDYSDTHEPNPYAVIQKIVDMVNRVKTGNRKVACINCSKDYYVFRTGKYGDFIYCPTCKTSTSRSTAVRMLCEKATKGYV